MPVSAYVEAGKAVNASPALRKQLIAILKTDQKKSMGANPGSSG